MAVALTGSGGLFTRLGLLGGILNSNNTYRGTTVPGKVDTLAAQFTTDQELVQSLYTQLYAWQSSNDGYLAAIQQVAELTLIEMVEADNPQPQKTPYYALAELIRQMEGSADSVNASSSAACSVSAASGNNGNAQLVTSVKLRSGKVAENLVAEDLIATCVADSQTGGLTEGFERLVVNGEANQVGSFDWRWPTGSGARQTVLVQAASRDANSGGNLLTNSDFEDFTTNAPDNWVIATGSAGTTVDDTATAYKGNKALAIVGNGSELTCLRQTFDDATGTLGEVKPLEQYAYNCFLRVSAAAAAGVLRIALVDGSGTVINDDAGTANSATKDLTTLNTTYAAFNGTFRLPKVLPSSVKLELKLTTALENGKSLYLDELVLQRMTQLYAQGPSVAAFAGATKLIVGDYWTLAASITAGGFQRLFDKWFNMKQLGLLLPSNDAAGETIGDALIT